MARKHKRNLSWTFAAGAAALGAAAMSGAGLLAGVAGRALWDAFATVSLAGKVVLITGASRGLGLAMAEECARQGCRLAICGRDQQSLDRAQQELRRNGAEVLALRCDVAKRSEVEEMVDSVLAHYGAIDVLINNAGTIVVGPLSAQTPEDFEEAMNVIFWGAVHTTLCVLPHMLERRRGRIANITSIGGKLAVPHMLPYTAAKFALVGFSEGLTAELASEGIQVTTVVPGLMRTGSHLNAFFKGNNRAEYTWFGISASTPFLAMDASRAARRVVQAIRRGEAEVVLGLPAKAAILAHDLAPEVAVRVLSAANRFMPAASEASTERHRGHMSETMPTRSPLTAFGKRAAKRWNQERLA
jgi:short-subunit dehydrogenase